MKMGEKIDYYEKKIDELKEHPSNYGKDKILTLEILLDILRELVIGGD